MSQTDVAPATPIHVIQLSRIENGHSGIRRERLMDLIAAINKLSTTGYKVDLSQALTKAGFAPASNGTHSEAGLFAGLDKIPVEQRKLAERQIQAIIDSFVAEDDHED